MRQCQLRGSPTLRAFPTKVLVPQCQCFQTQDAFNELIRASSQVVEVIAIKKSQKKNILPPSQASPRRGFHVNVCTRNSSEPPSGGPLSRTGLRERLRLKESSIFLKRSKNENAKIGELEVSKLATCPKGEVWKIENYSTSFITKLEKGADESGSERRKCHKLIETGKGFFQQWNGQMIFSRK